MNVAQGKADAGQTVKRPATYDLKALLIRVAWLSILLGLGMQALLVLIRIGNIPELQPLAAELVQKVSWAFVVCMGLAVGMGVSQASPPVMGLAGLIAAPVGFYVARSLHKGTAELLGISTTSAAGPDPFLIALLRGVEYLCLAAAIGWLGRRAWAGAKAYITAGLVAGLLFGGMFLALTSQSAPSAAALFAWGVNELVFPVGCSLILFVSEKLGKSVLS
ncbi:MAG: hypothetical protein ABIO92_11060 [Chloroflexia bacterium]